MPEQSRAAYHSQKNKKPLESENELQQIRETQQRIREKKSQKITFGKPILCRGESEVFFPRTINVIQGKAGAHKSRLAECICAAILKTNECTNELLKFSCTERNNFAICYVDTERNLSDQLPYALQQIQIKAGHGVEIHPERFDYISLLEFEREKRFQVLNIYLEHVQKHYPMHLFVVLDVVTDCVFNFNDTKDSMRLIDMMNRSINQYDVTFLCLIHENPGGGEKARGHLGTEILNKSSTVMQIGFVTDGKNQRTDLLKISFLKCRNSKKHESFYVQYSEKENGLIEASGEATALILESKIIKAPIQELLDLLGNVLEIEKTRTELIEIIMEELDCGKRTTISRLKYIMKNRLAIRKSNMKYHLISKVQGKEIIYLLEPEVN